MLEIEEKSLEASELKYSLGYVSEQDYKMAQYKGDKANRITSYNVCYTKLLRSDASSDFSSISNILCFISLFL